MKNKWTKKAYFPPSSNSRKEDQEQTSKGKKDKFVVKEKSKKGPYYLSQDLETQPPVIKESL